jgi:hypothetical protein
MFVEEILYGAHCPKTQKKFHFGNFQSVMTRICQIMVEERMGGPQVDLA